MVKSLCSHCRRHRFKPWCRVEIGVGGTKIPHATWQKKKKKPYLPTFIYNLVTQN